MPAQHAGCDPEDVARELRDQDQQRRDQEIRRVLGEYFKPQSVAKKADKYFK